MEIPIFILAGLINWQHEMYLSENFTFPRTAPCPLVPIICSEMSHMHSWAKFLLFAFSKLILTTGTQLLKQFVEDRKMQTIHLKGKFPTFTVICLSASSSWAAKWPKKREENKCEEKTTLVIKDISSPDHHGQRSGQTETEVQGLCLHRQEHQLCLQRGEMRKQKDTLVLQLMLRLLRITTMNWSRNAQLAKWTLRWVICITHFPSSL